MQMSPEPGAICQVHQDGRILFSLWFEYQQIYTLYIQTRCFVAHRSQRTSIILGNDKIQSRNQKLGSAYPQFFLLHHKFDKRHNMDDDMWFQDSE